MPKYDLRGAPVPSGVAVMKWPWRSAGSARASSESYSDLVVSHMLAARLWRARDGGALGAIETAARMVGQWPFLCHRHPFQPCDQGDHAELSSTASVASSVPQR